MTQQLKILNLSLDTASHVSTDEFLTCNNLESDLLSGALVNSQPHFTKRTLAQGSHNFVGANALLGLGLVSRRLHGILAGAARLGGFASIVTVTITITVTALMSVVVVVGRRGLLLLLAPDVG